MKSSLLSMFLFSLLLGLLLYSGPLSGAVEKEIHRLDYSDIQVKTLRDDIRKSIYITKSLKNPDLLPALDFFRYRVKKKDSFWVILSRTSQNIDTLLSVNALSSPADITPGKTLFIPNMRGIIHKLGPEETIQDVAKKYGINESYIRQVNKASGAPNKYLFIPCGILTNLERSLFLGTGFASPLKTGLRTSGFGRRIDPFKSRFQFHTGVDIACPTGTKILAARSGEVIFSGLSGGYGLLVVVRHAHDYYSYYGHLSKVVVQEGTSVKTGDLIAISGNSGRTTGPHLHFEVRRKSTPVNPGILLRQ